MEGIMTGIKPRENFQDKGMSNDMLSSIRGRIDLIDAVSGAGRQDNLSNLLISGGMNLLSGENEGDNVLQTLAGAYKQPTQQLFASQARDRSGKRAIAASLISKMGTGGLEKFRGIAKDLIKSNKKYRDQYGTDANAINKLAGDLFEKDQYRKPVSPDEAAYQKDKASIATLSSMKDKIYKSPSLTAPEAELVNEELNKIKKTGSYDIVDIGKIFADKDQDYSSMPSIKIKDQAGKPIELKVYAVEDEDYYSPGKLYYKISDRSWFKYNADNKSLVQMPGL